MGDCGGRNSKRCTVTLSSPRTSHLCLAMYRDVRQRGRCKKEGGVECAGSRADPFRGRHYPGHQLPPHLAHEIQISQRNTFLDHGAQPQSPPELQCWRYVANCGSALLFARVMRQPLPLYRSRGPFCPMFRLWTVLAVCYGHRNIATAHSKPHSAMRWCLQTHARCCILARAVRCTHGDGEGGAEDFAC